MLATRAAVELDAQRRGKNSNMDAVRELSELLKNSFDQEPDNAGGCKSGSLLDPSTIVLVGHALEAIPEKKVTKVAELEQILREVADWLAQSANNSNSSHAAALRDFCLALASGASAHNHDFRDEKPPHPYRR